MAAVGVLLVSIVLLGGALSLCPNGYLKHDDSCYKLVKTYATWAEATIYCRAMGSELVNLETAAEDHFMHGMLENEGGGYNPPRFWVGGNDLVTENQWMWATSHTKITGYTNWLPGQPDNNEGAIGENCMELAKMYQWYWNDENCEHKGMVIIYQLGGLDYFLTKYIK